MEKDIYRRFSYLTVILTRIVALSFALLFGLSGSQYAEAQETPYIELPITVSTDTGLSKKLSVGLDPNATEGIDAAFGELELPPPPPSSGFDVRLIDEDISASRLGEGVLVDIRSGPDDFVGDKVHEIRVQPGDSATTVTLSWTLPSEVTGHIEDVATGGTDISEPMSGEGSLTLKNPSVVNLVVKLSYDLNTDPTAKGDSHTATVNSTLSIERSEGVLTNDTDPDGDTLTASLASGGGPSGGSLDLKSSGAFTYTPDEGFAGSDSFTYVASDGSGGTDRARVTILVMSPPTAKDDSFSTREEEALVVDSPSKGLLANDSDPNGDPLSVSLVSSTSDGNLALNGDGTFEYQPDLGFTGTDQFQYEASDRTGRADTAQVTISVQSQNDAPKISSIDDQKIPEDSTTGLIAFSVSDEETPDADLSLSKKSDNTNLVPSDSIITTGPNDSGNATVHVTPRPDSSGSATISITVSDGLKAESTSFNLRVQAVNDGPKVLMTIPDDTIKTPSPPIKFTGLQNSVFGSSDGDKLSLTGISRAPSVLSVEDGTEGLVLKPESSGSAEVIFTASDSRDSTSADPFTLTVEKRPSGEEPPTEHTLAAIDKTEEKTIDLGDIGTTIRIYTVRKGGVIDGRFFKGKSTGSSTATVTRTRSQTSAGSKFGTEKKFEYVSPYHWEIDAETVQFDSANVRLQVARENVTGIGDPQEAMIIVDRSGDGNFERVPTQYDDAGTPSDSTDDVLIAEGLTGMSALRLASNSDQNPLPVEFSSFTATLDGSDVQLKWHTVSETNNAGFEVQRRTATEQGISWTMIGFVEGAGTTSESHSYRFKDTKLPFEAERLVYRLKQVDTDGVAQFSKEVQITLGASEEVVLHAPFPNPVRSHATLRYKLPKETDSRLAVYDLLGRRVVTLTNGHEEAGRKQVQFEAKQLSSGTYLLRLTAGMQIKTRRFVVVR